MYLDRVCEIKINYYYNLLPSPLLVLQDHSPFIPVDLHIIMYNNNLLVEHLVQMVYV